MRISRVYTGRAMAIGDELTLDTATTHYVRNVLRLKSGALVDLFSEHHQADYRASLQISAKQCIANIESLVEFNSESSFKIDLLLGLSRGDHLDWSIQKATELGVRNITLFNADHSQMPIKSSQQEKKLAHWKAIAIKACEQSRRHLVPGVELCKNLTTVLNQNTESNYNWIASFEGERFQEMKLESGISAGNLLVGPEGGFSTGEIALATNHGFRAFTLGPRVLRTETAVATGLSIIQNRLGDI